MAQMQQVAGEVMQQLSTNDKRVLVELGISQSQFRDAIKRYASDKAFARKVEEMGQIQSALMHGPDSDDVDPDPSELPEGMTAEKATTTVRDVLETSIVVMEQVVGTLAEKYEYKAGTPSKYSICLWMPKRVKHAPRRYSPVDSRSSSPSSPPISPSRPSPHSSRAVPPEMVQEINATYSRQYPLARAGIFAKYGVSEATMGLLARAYRNNPEFARMIQEMSKQKIERFGALGLAIASQG